jgi:hypothetical protein
MPAQQQAPQQAPQAAIGGIDPTDPQAPIKVVMSVAKEIRARNPNIDPQTLFQATEQVINLSKGLDPAIRQGAQVVVQQMKDQTANRNTDVRAATSERNTDVRSATQERGQNMRLQEVQQQVGASMQRVQFVQSNLNQRFQSGQITKAQKDAGDQRIKLITSQLTNANRTLATLKNSATGQLDETDPRVKDAEAKVADSQKKLDQMEKVYKGSAPAAPGGGAPGGGGQPTASDGKGNIVVWDPVKKAWVPQGK